MENFFSLDGKFFRFINKFTSLIALNFLFIITSLPIFTIGVSFYALYQTNLKLSQNTESYIARTYFSFGEKFKAKYSSLATCNDFIYILSD